MTKPGQYYTFENEAKLPHLPVPSLMSTTSQLLTCLKPLLSSEEYFELVNESSEFLSNGLINLVQDHLVAVSEHPDYSSYLNVVNGDLTPAIYGELRSDILPRNPYLILEEDPYSKTLNPPNQAERAANLINSSLKFIISLRNETLKPDVTPKNNNPLSMTCYRNLFGTTRVPSDSQLGVSAKKYSHINDSRHILIIANNQYYTLEVITEYTEKEYETTKSKHKIWFNDHELSLILQGIINESDKIGYIDSIKNSIGSMTTQSSKHWKLARLELENSNKENMKRIDDALFVVVLDSNSPITDQEKTWVVCHGSSVLSDDNVQIGTCTWRWYDKLQLIVTKNSVAGVVWESMIMDSTAILRFISDIYTDSVLKLAKNINGSEYTLFDENVEFVDPSETKPEAQLIEFNKTQEVKNIIHLSETRLADLINQHEYKTLNIKLNSHLTSNFNLSVDSILQIGFQITNYSLYGRMINTIEPITTRKFHDCRTELIPIQNDSISDLVKLYITSANSSEKFEAFKRCCDIHTKQYHEAMVGKGFERHLLTIIQVLKDSNVAAKLNEINKDKLKPIPDLNKINAYVPLIFNPIIDKLSNPELLISNCGNPALLLFGIPPAVDQGFGIGYIIHSDKVIITICSKHRQTGRFLDTFHRVIHELKVNLKTRSSYLLSMTDSEQRKLELQRLRVEQELKNVEIDIPSKRHPIQLTIDQEPIPLESLPMIKEPTKDSVDQEQEQDQEQETFELMGGYGYFDYGELEERSDELSRNESYLTSKTHSHTGSRTHSHAGSALGSRHHSGTNLAKLVLTAPGGLNYDIKNKQSLSEQIREKLNQTEVEPEQEEEDEQSDTTPELEVDVEAKRKSSIGRKLDISKRY
ncbi:Carnitine O-acetyltransferase YAT2 [Spathaspora sp. JA1]|nr:Carnitine O-acetyltransferase YAT2 [Spathaspora sp. JA1]